MDDIERSGFQSFENHKAAVETGGLASEAVI